MHEVWPVVLVRESSTLLISPVYTYHLNRVKFVASQARAAISTVRECLHLALVRCNCTGQSTRRLVKCACALSVNVAMVTMEPSSMILLFRCISARHMRRLAPSNKMLYYEAEEE